MEHDPEALAEELKCLILDWKNRHGGFPYVVEVSGVPKAGKTKNIEIVSHLLRRKDLLVHTPPEGPEVVAKSYNRISPVLYNVALAHYTVDVLLRWAFDHHIDLLILDRGPLDRICWYEALAARGDIANEEAAVNINYLNQSIIRNMIRCRVLLVCEPEVSLRREAKDKLTVKEGGFVNKSLLDILHASFPATFKRFTDGSKGCLIDTTHQSPLDTALEILDFIYESLKV